MYGEHFHLSCVDLVEPPAGEWICAQCRQDISTLTASGSSNPFLANTTSLPSPAPIKLKVFLSTVKTDSSPLVPEPRISKVVTGDRIAMDTSQAAASDSEEVEMRKTRKTERKPWNYLDFVEGSPDPSTNELLNLGRFPVETINLLPISITSRNFPENVSTALLTFGVNHFAVSIPGAPEVAGNQWLSMHITYILAARAAGLLPRSIHDLPSQTMTPAAQFSTAQPQNHSSAVVGPSYEQLMKLVADKERALEEQARVLDEQKRVLEENRLAMEEKDRALEESERERFRLEALLQEQYLARINRHTVPIERGIEAQMRLNQFDDSGLTEPPMGSTQSRHKRDYNVRVAGSASAPPQFAFGDE